MKAITIDTSLLENCLYAFNMLANKHLGNGVKTYDLASDIDGVMDGVASATIAVDEALLKNCLYAFNEIPNRKLRNGVKTYDLASQLSAILRQREAA